jgi:hypothetical protein
MMTDISFDGREAFSSTSPMLRSSRMAQVIAFPRPIDPRACDGSDNDQAKPAILPSLNDAIATLLASGRVWHAKVDELQRRLDDLGSFIDSLDDSDAKRALCKSHAAMRKALILTGDGLNLQLQVLSKLPANAAGRVSDGERATRPRSVRSTIASWFGARGESV